MNIEKFYNENGDVAVLYSPGYGAGWASWSGEHDGAIFDKRIVEIVLADKREDITQELMVSFGYGYFYCGGADSLEIEWLKPGTIFDIDEYDGSESVITIDHLHYVA